MTADLVPHRPEHDRLDALGRGLRSAALAVVGVALVALALEWPPAVTVLVLAAAAVPALVVPLLRWRRAVARQERLPVGHLDPAWRAMVADASAAVDRLEAEAASAPPGPVADHLRRMADAGRVHLRVLCDTAGESSRLGSPSRAVLWGDARLTARRLGELADAAARLRAAQRRHLGHDPIASLIEATDRLASTLEGELTPAEPPAPGPVPSDAPLEQGGPGGPGGQRGPAGPGPAPLEQGGPEVPGGPGGQRGPLSARGAAGRRGRAWPTTGR
jgi:hypothetical protein